MRRYNPKEIEAKWQATWDKTGLYKTDEDESKDKYYCLVMFPYPSGNLHVGHWYNFGPADVVARYHRMRGQRVLHPFGFDAFGLPAENAAIKRAIPPAEWTRSNIASMKKQLNMIGAMYDWSKEISTADPNYYRWTQWLFLKLYNNGLAERKGGLVNWCPKDKTVLANEQVVGENNECERCGTPVIQKDLEQWYFKITDYADALLEDAKELDWPDRVKTMQSNWIGKSSGAEITFRVDTPANYLLLHGFEGDSEGCFLPKLKASLEQQGYKVAAPNLPNTDKPDAKEQAIAAAKAATIDSDTVIVGHSYGTVTALRLVEGLSAPVKKLVLVAGFAEPGLLDVTLNFESTTDWEFDFDRIKQNAKEIIVLRDTSDTIVPSERADYLVAKLNAKLVDVKATEPHFCGADEPAIFNASQDSLSVYTTRHDTQYGVTFLVLAPEHPLVPKITTSEQQASVDDYLQAAAKKTELERQQDEKTKTGVFTGAYAVNPVNEEKIPIWVSDYVLMNYGTGAVMGVPAHDDRDHAFAKQYDLEIRQVLKTDNESDFHSEGQLINSDKYSGMRSEQMREQILEDMTEAGYAKERVNYRLRDWLISRQRYWGAPIPIIYCNDCGTVPVPEDQLPVVLPEDVEFEPTGQSPLLKIDKFVNTQCPKCGKAAKRETDTIDTFVDSSWYFLRYPNTNYSEGPFDPEAIKKWMPVDHYIGGIEHAILHLLYARFICKALKDHADLPFDEPFTKLSNQGIILGPDGQKMSKSKGNVVDPDDQVGSYGADSLRLYLMFMGPYDQGGPYDFGGIAGVRRFLDRVWNLVMEFQAERASGRSAELHNQSGKLETQLVMATHKTLRKVTKDLEELGFNTAIASMMELINTMTKLRGELAFINAPDVWHEQIEILVRMLAPFAPHMSEELWHELGNDQSVHIESWPTWDPELIKQDVVTIVVQVGGKVRGSLVAAPDSSKEELVELAKAEPNVARHLESKKIDQVIHVPGRLINLVVSD